MISLLLALGCNTPDEAAAPVAAPSTPAETPAGRPFTLVYSADVEGEIEPCG